MSYITTDLTLENGKKIQYNNSYIETIKDEIATFLENEKYMHNLRFAKKMMMSQEIKSNNSIEGINDDLTLIDEIIKNKKTLSTYERNRIVNLYHGYQYILTHKEINKDSLRELYGYLSDGLLDLYSINNMGQYYRQKPVYILKGCRIDTEPDMGLDAQKIDVFMNNLFEYINNHNTLNNDQIEHYIKSQIIHFYFVYIHPYFDINGRTSRTVSMWYLLNNKNYPYIIFNRAIAFNQRRYEPCIVRTKETGNITLFLEYMLNNVKHEFEKECIIHCIEQSSSKKLTKDNLQTLEYILTMNNNITAKDFVVTYYRFNDKRKPGEIVSEKLVPLIDKNIIVQTRNTSKNIFGNIPNYEFRINQDLINDLEKDKIKTIKLEKYFK